MTHPNKRALPSEVVVYDLKLLLMAPIFLPVCHVAVLCSPHAAKTIEACICLPALAH
jgi:hypothetical protein